MNKRLFTALWLVCLCACLTTRGAIYQNQWTTQPDSALPSPSAVVTNGTTAPLNVSGIGISNGVASAFGFYGNGANVNAQSVAGPEMWNQLRKPEYVFFYMTPYPNPINTNGNYLTMDNESNVLAKLNFIQTNGLLSSMTNFGYKVAFHFDEGWDQRRNFNPSFVFTNLGTLMWDQQMYPDGLPWLINKLKTNGVYTFLSIYQDSSVSFKIPPSASGWTCDNNGNNLRWYTNGVGSGYIYTNLPTGLKAVEISTPEYLQSDITEMHWWGAAGVIPNDFAFASIDDITSLERAVADSTMKVYIFNGFNQSQTATYFTQNLGAMSWTATNGLSGTNAVSWLAANTKEESWEQLFTSRLLYLPYEEQRFNVPNNNIRVYGDQTRKFHQGIYYENSDAPFNGDDLTNYVMDFASTSKIYEGARMVSGQGNNAMMMGMFVGAIPEMDTKQWTDVYGNTFWITNTLTLPIANDPLQSMPVKVYDDGASGGYVWARQMTNGVYALLIGSHAGGTNNWQPPITWDKFGFSTNDYCTITFLNGLTLGAYTAFPGGQSFTQKVGSTNVILGSATMVQALLQRVPDGSQLNGNVVAQPGFVFSGNGSGITQTNVTITYPFTRLLNGYNGTACSPAGLPGSPVGHGFLIPAGTAFSQPVLYEDGKQFGSFTNFQCTTTIYTTNGGTLVNWNWTMEADYTNGTDTISQPVTSQAIATGTNVTSFSQTLTISPSNAGKVSQLTMASGTAGVAFATNVWIMSFTVKAY